MISLQYRDQRPIYEQVKDSICQLIVGGALEEGVKLPSVRELAVELTVNPNTIQRAYRELEAEGYIVSVPGKGSFVNRGGVAAAARRRELDKKLRELTKELLKLGMSGEQICSIVSEEASKND